MHSPSHSLCPLLSEQICHLSLDVFFPLFSFSRQAGSQQVCSIDPVTTVPLDGGEMSDQQQGKAVVVMQLLLVAHSPESLQKCTVLPLFPPA